MIKNLMFDLGGVIMDIRRTRCIEAYDKLGLPDAASYFGDYEQKPPFSTLEEGLITPDQFHSDVRKLITHPITDTEIDAAFCRFLIGIPTRRLRMLEDLHRNFRIYLLSNTNPVLWDQFIIPEFKKDGHDINHYFDGITTSFEAKCMKPSPEIFSYAARTMDIVPAETLFLDDSEANCLAAERCGFAASHVLGL